jgi:RNA recognition motif-containing protein
MLESYDRPLEVKYAEDPQAKEQRLEKDKVEAKKKQSARDQDAAGVNDARGSGPTLMNRGHEEAADPVYSKPPANSHTIALQPKYPWSANEAESSSKTSSSWEPQGSGTDFHVSKEVLQAWNKHLCDQKAPKNISEAHNADATRGLAAKNVKGDSDGNTQVEVTEGLVPPLPVPRTDADDANDEDHPAISDEASTDDSKGDACSASSASMANGAFEEGQHAISAEVCAKESNATQSSGAVEPTSQSQQGSQTTNIYVARLPDWVTDEGLRTKFEQFGTILSCKVLNGRSGPKGVGFVQYTTPEMAMKAVNAMNNTCMGNKTIDVRLAHRDKNKGVQNQPSTNIYVCNLPKSYGEAELYALFSPHGAIESLIVLMDRKTGESKCVGMIRFANLEDARAAVEALNGRMLESYDRPLEVKYAEDPKAKEQRLEKDKVEAKKKQSARDQDAAGVNDARGCGPTLMNRGHEEAADPVYSKPPGWTISHAVPRASEPVLLHDQQQRERQRWPRFSSSNFLAEMSVEPKFPWTAAVTEDPKISFSALSERSGTDQHVSKEVLAAWNKHLRVEKAPMEIFDDHGALALTEFDDSIDPIPDVSMGNDVLFPLLVATTSQTLLFCPELSTDAVHVQPSVSSSPNEMNGSPDGVDLVGQSEVVSAGDPWATPFQKSFPLNNVRQSSVAPSVPFEREALFAPFRASMGKLGDDSPGLTFSAATEGGQPSPILGPLMLDNARDAAALLPLSV